MARPPLKLERWGTISVTKSKPYTASAWYRDSTGARRRMRRIGRTQADARANLEDALHEMLVATGESDLSPDSTIATLAELWWSEYVELGRAHGTLNSYESTKRAIIATIGDLRIREATVPYIDRHLKQLAAAKSPSSARRRRTVLDMMLDVAVRHGATTFNAAELANPPAPRRQAVVAPSAEQLDLVYQRLVAYDARPRTGTSLARFADLLLATGARTSEILAVRWPDIDFDEKKVSITGTLTTDHDTGKLIRQDHPKSASGRRRLTLPDYAIAVLLNARTSALTEMVLPSSTGTLWSPANLRRSWRAALTTPSGEQPVGIESLTPRAYRKAVATALERALGAEAAGQQLGHADSTVTKMHYIERLFDAPDATQILEQLRQSGQ